MPLIINCCGHEKNIFSKEVAFGICVRTTVKLCTTDQN